MPTPRTPRRRIRRVAFRLALALACFIAAIVVRHVAHWPTHDSQPPRYGSASMGDAWIWVKDFTLLTGARRILAESAYRIGGNPRIQASHDYPRVIVLREQDGSYVGRWAHFRESIMLGIGGFHYRDPRAYGSEYIAVYRQQVRIQLIGITTPILLREFKDVELNSVAPNATRLEIGLMRSEADRVLREVPITIFDEWYPDGKPPAVEVSRVARENALLTARSGWILRNVPFELACTGLLLASLWFTVRAGRVALGRDR
ncbi:MAG: hypothetical protein AAGD00_00665 [Planctomycetota bacterium]